MLDEATAALNETSREAHLVAMLRAGTPGGLADLYDYYGALIFSTAFHIVHDHGAAEEITQDVVLRCWRMIDRYQPAQGSLATWLLTITRNRAIDELRSRRGIQRSQEVPADAALPWAKMLLTPTRSHISPAVRTASGLSPTTDVLHRRLL